MDFDKSHIIVGLVSAVAVAAIQFLGFGATYGRIATTVEDIERRVEKIEAATAPVTKVGDLCLKLMEAQNIAYRSSDKETRQEIAAQMKTMGCYDYVPLIQPTERDRKSLN